MSFPIIDISKIDNPDSQLLLANEITLACNEWGFLLLKNHPIPTGSVEELFTLGKAFFSLSESDKEPWPITPRNIGYIGSFKDRNKDDKMSMWFGGKSGELKDNPQSLPPFWHGYEEKIEGFKHQCHSLILKLLVCFALAMELPDRNFFADKHKDDVGKGNSLRMLMYPARGEKPEGTRMQEHTDSGSVTLLFQKQAGLEIRSPSGEWVKAPCVDDCILVNLGDALSFWSGRKLKATSHRVTFEGVSHDQERQSMAYFGAANPETVLTPLVKGQEILEKYVTNGLELEPGITVGELSRMIMTRIYGTSMEEPTSRTVAVES